MGTLLTVLAVGLALWLLLFGVVFVAGWRLARRAGRKVRASRYRRGVMVVRGVSTAEPTLRRIHQARVKLLDSGRATSQVLATISRSPRSSVLAEATESAGLAKLATEVTASMRATDHLLVLLAREPDAALRAELSKGLLRQADQLCGAAGELRSIVWRFATVTDRDHSMLLATEVADRVAGLRAGLTELYPDPLLKGAADHD